MCWRLSVLLFGGREGHWNTKNRFIKDKNNLLAGGFYTIWAVLCALAESLVQGGSGQSVLLRGERPGRCNWTQQLRERENSSCVCWGTACQHLWAWLAQPSGQQGLVPSCCSGILLWPLAAKAGGRRRCWALLYKSLPSPSWKKNCFRPRPWNAFLSETCL